MYFIVPYDYETSLDGSDNRVCYCKGRWKRTASEKAVVVQVTMYIAPEAKIDDVHVATRSIQLTTMIRCSTSSDDLQPG